MGTDPSRLLDGILSGSLLLIGLSVLFVAVAFVGLAWWMAGRMSPRGTPPILARAAVGAGAALGLTVGLWMIAMGTEAAAGFPLGPSSGGSAFVAWYGGAKVASIDAAATMGLSWQLADRTGVRGDETLGWVASAWAFATWALAKLCGWLLFVVALGVML